MSAKKNLIASSIIVIAAVGIGTYIITTTLSKRAQERARIEKEEETERQKETEITKEQVILPKQTWNLLIPVDEAPRKVYGSWTSRRIREGADDTIVKACVYDTDGKVVKVWERWTDGNFSFTVKNRGNVKFEFSNAEIKRSTSRKVTLNVKLQ